MWGCLCPPFLCLVPWLGDILLMYFNVSYFGRWRSPDVKSLQGLAGTRGRRGPPPALQPSSVSAAPQPRSGRLQGGRPCPPNLLMQSPRLTNWPLKPPLPCPSGGRSPPPYLTLTYRQRSSAISSPRGRFSPASRPRPGRDP